MNKINMIQCANGHYYDGDLNRSCPYCSTPNGQPGGDPDNDKTESFFNPAYQPGGMEPIGSSIPVTSAEDPYQRQQAPTYMPQQPVKPTETAPRGGDLWVDDDPKTEAAIYMGPRQGAAGRAAKAPYEEDLERTVAMTPPIRPVVGWLVCTSGVNYGQCYNLYSGKNFVGRDSSNDICLSGDQSISRSKHTVIIYEPTRREFFVTLGDDSHELVYQNGNVVLSSKKLEDRDVLRLGRTELVFVPFCDARNGWGVGEPEE